MVEIKGKRASLIVFLVLIIGISALSTMVVHLNGVPLGDSVYWTACSLTWSNCYGSVDIPDTLSVRIISIVDGIATIVIILVFLYAIGENILGFDLRGLRMENRISNMKNHFIVCGYGRVGEHVCEAFMKKGVRFVVIESDGPRLDRLKETVVPVVQGNAIEHKVLEKAGIKRAKGIVTTLDSDADNLFVVLAAKEMNPGIKAAARARNESAINKLHMAGAEVVVLPEVIGGYEMAKEMLQLEESHKDRLISKVEGLLKNKS